VHELFAQEIEAAYAAMDNDFSNGNGNVQELNPEDLEAGIRDMVKSVFAGIEGQDAEQDFFERGMDSLQAVRLARLLSIAIQRHSKENEADSNLGKVSAEFIYRHSSIARLTAAVKKRVTASEGRPNGSTDELDRISEVNALAEKFVREISSNTNPTKAAPVERSRAVLMTGATGNLGAHMLSQMARNPSVTKIVCLYRSSSAASQNGNGNSAADAAFARLQAAVKSAGLTVSAEGWQKVELVEDAEFMRASQQYTKERHESIHGADSYHEDEPMFSRLAREITHIAHLAWPMDFHRTASSFIPHLQMVESLVRLSRLAHALKGPGSTRRVRLVFASSIAVVRNYKHDHNGARKIGVKSVPEAVTESASVPVPMGYAEAKWICERMLQQVALTCNEEVDPVVVRIGQLSGPETTNGVWKIGEHIPTLVKASRMIGAFPLLDGVSIDLRPKSEELPWLTVT
jgi:nucleoside-diphosphate-sugar epimerase